MAVPKKRTPSGRRNKRRSHHAKGLGHLTTCPQCKAPVPGHTACPNCGTYKGKQILDVSPQADS